MAYIIVLNPIILGAGEDKFHQHLDNGQLVTATALMAGLTTLLMGVIGNVPIALAAGLGINAVVALQLAPKMSWPDAMGMVVLAGIVLMILVASGLRQRVMDAIPNGLRRAIAIGIGLFISLIGLVDSGFVSRNPDKADTTVPLGLGTGGQLQGWPVLVFVLGLVLMYVLLVRKTRGAILIGIVTMAVVAIVINAVADIPDAAWGLSVPKLPDSVVGSPDFGLIGEISLFGGSGGRVADRLPLRLHGAAVGLLRRDGHHHHRRGRGERTGPTTARTDSFRGWDASCSWTVSGWPPAESAPARPTPASWSPPPGSARARAPAWPTC